MRVFYTIPTPHLHSHSFICVTCGHRSFFRFSTLDITQCIVASALFAWYYRWLIVAWFKREGRMEMKMIWWLCLQIRNNNWACACVRARIYIYFTVHILVYVYYVCRHLIHTMDGKEEFFAPTHVFLCIYCIFIRATCTSIPCEKNASNLRGTAMIMAQLPFSLTQLVCV